MNDQDSRCNLLLPAPLLALACRDVRVPRGVGHSIGVCNKISNSFEASHFCRLQVLHQKHQDLGF